MCDDFLLEKRDVPTIFFLKPLFCLSLRFALLFHLRDSLKCRTKIIKIETKTKREEEEEEDKEDEEEEERSFFFPLNKNDFILKRL